ncbi:MAG TPA: 4-hydroxythreonine-4-phosphate dehydrogenase PdxA [Steroidobacteraceae bacterium]|nr:4-hydroxythreonine-4-phosphate dehydrogenase PdxA [Steroidobacteraceae bacterium]
MALTAGEPAGIGPDLCLAAAARPRAASLVCLADREQLAARAQLLGLPIRLQDYRPGETVSRAAGTLTVLHQPLRVTSQPGRLDVRNAAQVLQLIGRAVSGCQQGEFAAMVTAPVQKSLINDAGVAFSGHTEHIAALTGSARPVMMLTAGTLRVALATTHLPLRAVSAALSIETLQQTLQILDDALRRYFDLPRPRIAVCGLNPHAGEGGHLGDEEITTITPAIERARAAGLAVEGPLPADTLFVPRQLERCDAVLAMYHDQGLPVLKHAGFGQAVNVTLGLPFVRTSVDHGTALALAGRGEADAGSLIAAIELASQMARRAVPRTCAAS